MPGHPERQVEVDVRMDGTKAVVEGKTSVPLKTFVQLVLQRKVTHLLREAGDEPLIVGSGLLTSLASAPQDSQENRSQLVLVTLGVGVLAGVFGSALALAVLAVLQITPTLREYAIVAGSLAGLAALAAILMRIKRRNKSQKLTETMEQLTGFLSR